jgi:hypothetical protein
MGSTAQRQQRSTATKQAVSIPAIGRRQPAITEEAVRLRAYEIYLRRANEPGNDVSDWLEAERELQANQPEISVPGGTLT